MAMSRSDPPTGPLTFGAIRRWLARFDLAVCLVLAAYVLFAANIIIFRHPVRLDLTRDRIHTLSQATRDRLALVREEILVVIPTYLQRENPEHEARREVLSRARALLDEYIALQPLIRIAAEVDVISQVEDWIRIRDEYDLSAGQFNRFLFFSGASRDVRQTVKVEDMADFVQARDPLLAPPEIRNFRAEKALTDAITRLVEREQRAVYFTQDREELALPREERGERPAGLRVLSRELSTHGFVAKEASLGALARTTGEIPADCEALVVPGPLQEYSTEEAEVVRRYLDRGGRLFVLLGTGNSGLEYLLEDWGVSVRPGEVLQAQVGPGGRAVSYWVSVRAFSRTHPITRVFANLARFEMTLYMPRALKAGGAGKGRDATVLLEAGSGGEGEVAFLVVGQGENQTRERGTFPVAVAVEQFIPERPPPGFRRVDTRLVVVGARNFIDDKSFMHSPHRDFFMNSLAWLIGEESRATISGEEWSESMLPMGDASARKFLLWVPIGLLPAVFLAFAALVYYARRT